MVADLHILNLQSLAKTGIISPLMLLRIVPSRVSDIVRCADVSSIHP
jgi:predicted amino acid racemase